MVTNIAQCVSDRANACWKSTSDEAKRTMILDAAMSLFGDRGFDGPTMDDLAAAAGYSRRSLYRFFPSKERLGAALSLRSVRRLFESLGPVETAPLGDLLDSYYAFSVEHPTEFRLILETRPKQGVDLQLQLEPQESDELNSWANSLRSRLSPRGRELFAAAIGYVEFRFRHKTIWESAGMGGDMDAVRSALNSMIDEETS
jgi:AcrR family transcriptional regulator